MTTGGYGSEYGAEWGGTGPTSAPLTGITYDDPDVLYDDPSISYDGTTVIGVIRGYDNTIPTEHMASSGADGTIDLDNYLGAPGWSQILDITRCPQYVLPWLGQFIGVQL